MCTTRWFGSTFLTYLINIFMNYFVYSHWTAIADRWIQSWLAFRKYIIIFTWHVVVIVPKSLARYIAHMLKLHSISLAYNIDVYGLIFDVFFLKVSNRCHFHFFFEEHMRKLYFCVWIWISKRKRITSTRRMPRRGEKIWDERWVDASSRSAIVSVLLNWKISKCCSLQTWTWLAESLLLNNRSTCLQLLWIWQLTRRCCSLHTLLDFVAFNEAFKAEHSSRRRVREERELLYNFCRVKLVFLPEERRRVASVITSIFQDFFLLLLCYRVCWGCLHSEYSFSLHIVAIIYYLWAANCQEWKGKLSYSPMLCT